MRSAPPPSPPWRPAATRATAASTDRPVLALTGATGFLGARIGAFAVDAGYDVRALVRPARDGGPRRLDFPAEQIAGGLADDAAVADLVAGADAVIHNAGLVRARSSAQFMQANRDGAEALAAATAAGANASVPFLLISSLAAGRPGVSPYAASKAAGEAAVRAKLAGRPFAILRPPAIYGPRDAATKPLFDAFRRGFAPVVGPRTARLAMIHVDDAARAALASLDAAAMSGPVYEADDGGGGHRWAEIAAAASASTGRKVRPLPIPGPLVLAAGAVGSLVAALGLGAPFLTIGKAREALVGDWIVDPERAPPGWTPTIPLQSGFTTTLTWYRDRRR